MPVDHHLEGVEEVVLQVHQEEVVVEVDLPSLVKVEEVEHQAYLELVVEVEEVVHRVHQEVVVGVEVLLVLQVVEEVQKPQDHLVEGEEVVAEVLVDLPFGREVVVVEEGELHQQIRQKNPFWLQVKEVGA